jgi:hypothetical protein
MCSIPVGGKLWVSGGIEERGFLKAVCVSVTQMSKINKYPLEARRHEGQ